ncbi:MAG: N-acetylmuramidase family protein [Candidatus Thiothrix moscowensis]|nr:N-acetylmuramidase family protein [Candidatus Thiothrix moscowensis]
MFSQIKKQSENTQAVTQAQALLLASGYAVMVDGNFGDKTEAAVKQFQLDNNLVADGIIGEKTWQVLLIKANAKQAVVTSRFLSEQDLLKAAGKLGIEVAAIKAVNEVESRGSGFLHDFPVILFERHIFWKRLQAWGIDPAPLAADNENILGQKWDRQYYFGGVKEIGRLEQAKAIHVQAALESASWGAFQIMGFHWKKLGYANVEEFVARMMSCEAEHLEAFSRYIATFGCIRGLRLPAGQEALTLDNFRQFAHCYNGPSYEQNKYHSKMFSAYLRYRKQTQQAPVTQEPLAA